MKKLYGWLIAAGGVLIALGKTEPQIGPHYKLSSSMFLILTTGGAVLIVVGVMGTIGYTTIQKISSWIDRRGKASEENVHPVDFAMECDLRELHRLYSAEFGSDVPAIAQMHKWWACNPRIFLKVTELNMDTGKRRIVASVKIIPIRKEVIPFLDAEEISGTRFVESHIATPDETPAGWYIGDLVSTSSTSAGKVMEALVVYLAYRVEPDTLIYARPLSADGLHYMKKYGFKPVRNSDKEFGHIFRQYGRNLSERVSNLRCLLNPELLHLSSPDKVLARSIISTRSATSDSAETPAGGAGGTT